MPAPTEQREDWSLDVRGWVIGAESRAVAVEGIHEGRTIWSVPVDVERPRTAAEHPGAPDERIGFHSLSGTLPLAPEFELELQAVLADGTRLPVSRIRAQELRGLGI